MKRYPSIAVVIAAALSLFSSVSTGPVFAQAPVRDGRWEVSTEMDMPGMPMKIPAMKTIQCVTKEQADDPNQSVPKGRQGKDSDCKVSDYKISGNKVTWTMKCEGKNAMTGNGEITYATDAYDGWMKMKTGDTEMTMKYTGKRLGDCTKERHASTAFCAGSGTRPTRAWPVSVTPSSPLP